VRLERAGFMVWTLAASFFLLYGYSLLCYCRGIPAHKPPVVEEEAPPGGFCAVFAPICEGLSIVCSSRPIACRLVFFALEIALEDAMVALVCAEYGMLIMAPDNALHGNFWSGVLIGGSKIGGVLTGAYMNRVWNNQTKEEKSYYPLFACCGLGGLCALAVPAATEVWGMAPSTGSGDTLMRDCVVFGGIFLFFFFTTAPKVGFGVLTQELIGETEQAGAIWGFGAAFITITDSVVIFVFSVLFEPEVASLQKALWITSGCFAAIGLIEAILGPSLFLPDPEEEQHAGKPDAEQSLLA